MSYRADLILLGVQATLCEARETNKGIGTNDDGQSYCVVTIGMH